MVTPPKWGQHVLVDRHGIRADVKRAIGANLKGRVINVVPPDASLGGCVLIAFEGADIAQWVHHDHIRDDSA
jgi:hypothetical protein